jgi:hypothetical protein
MPEEGFEPTITASERAKTAKNFRIPSKPGLLLTF